MASHALTATRHGLRALWVLMVLATALAACNKDEGDGAAASASAPPPPPPPELPPPFSKVRLGDTLEQIKAAYPAGEEVGKCAPQLAGGDTPMPAQTPGAENKARSMCSRAIDVSGLTDTEGVKVMAVAANSGGDDTVEVAQALFYIMAQIRGSLRAGTIGDDQVFQASGTSKTVHDALLHVAGKFYDGSTKFVAARSSRRPICACVAADCAGLEREQVRKYILGGFNLGTLDGEARKRVAHGKCRGPYVQNEQDFRRKFVAATGGLAAVGVARAAQKEGKLDPENLTTYSAYSIRSGLDPKTARLGVEITNGIEKAEAYWKGAIALLPGKGEETNYGRAMVWLTGGKVSRVMVNVSSDDKLGDLPKELGEIYGKPASSEGTKTVWKLPSGVTATLDIGGALALILEGGGAAPTKGEPPKPAPAGSGT